MGLGWLGLLWLGEVERRHGWSPWEAVVRGGYGVYVEAAGQSGRQAAGSDGFLLFQGKRTGLRRILNSLRRPCSHP